jgi:SAM-dependent methyltransferase
MVTSTENATRGYGLLEGFLARQRYKMAERLIPDHFRRGRILDIGCGLSPIFLITTSFSEKYGLDKNIREEHIKKQTTDGIVLLRFDLEEESRLPFPDDSFDVVTMLAVFEHIEPSKLQNILQEIHRILKEGGRYILTTPAWWIDKLLRSMSKIGFVSRVEIEEHKSLYNPKKISLLLQQANFSSENIRFGYFEMFANIWMTAIK